MMKGARYMMGGGDRPLFAWVGTAIADVTAATVGVCVRVYACMCVYVHVCGCVW